MNNDLPHCTCGGKASWVVKAPDPLTMNPEPTVHRLVCEDCGLHTDAHRTVKDTISDWRNLCEN